MKFFNNVFQFRLLITSTKKKFKYPICSISKYKYIFLKIRSKSYIIILTCF